jgi:hypothetical protein
MEAERTRQDLVETSARRVSAEEPVTARILRKVDEPGTVVEGAEVAPLMPAEQGIGEGAVRS